jgi:hypothetical protein
MSWGDSGDSDQSIFIGIHPWCLDSPCGMDDPINPWRKMLVESPMLMITPHDPNQLYRLWLSLLLMVKSHSCPIVVSCFEVSLHVNPIFFQLNHIKSQYSPICPMIPMLKSCCFQVKSLRTARVFRVLPIRAEMGHYYGSEDVVSRVRSVIRSQGKDMFGRSRKAWWGTAIHRNRNIYEYLTNT